MAGRVFLVGAGPGDPGLITVRGRELLERADAIIYDSLVNEILLDCAPQAEHVFVGKRPNRHALPQDDINRLLIEYAQRYRFVVRLKGGDPFVFGRGGEEAIALAEAGIAFEIVPGVTAGIAAAATAGIPVTHRGIAASVTFLTGHSESEDAGLELDRLHLDGTLVVFMGVKTLKSLSEKLLRLGRNADTPAAVIQWGTLGRQRTATSSLGDIAAAAAAEGIESPAIVVVGEVVELRSVLSWFERRPLYGKRVAVTGTRQPSAELVRQLQDLGADVFEFPTIEIATDSGLGGGVDVTGFDWIVLASPNAVESLFDRLQRQTLDARALHGIRLCAIGAKTADSLSQHYVRVDANPPRYDSHAVVSEMTKVGGPLKGSRVLIPRADVARSNLPIVLRDAGADVTELRSYRTTVPRDAQEMAAALLKFRPEYVTFISGASARNFAAIVGPERLRDLASAAVFAAIGPITAEAAHVAGIHVTLQPRQHTTAALVEALAQHAAAVIAAPR